MQKLTAFIIFLFFATHAFPQYYIRGEIKDQFGKPIPNVKIYLPTSGFTYYSGISGGFGISSKLFYDSLVLTKDGYLSSTLRVNSNEYQNIILKLNSVSLSNLKPKLVTLSTIKEAIPFTALPETGETYSNLIENRFVKTGIDNKLEP